MSNELLQKVIDLTQLPSDEITQELEKLLENEGVEKDSVTLGQLREALATYMQDIFSDYEEKLTDQSSDVHLKLVTIN